MFVVFLLNMAGVVACAYFGYLYLYFAGSFLMSLISIFFLANRRERDSYKAIAFLTIMVLPLLGIAYAVIMKEKMGSPRLKKEWSDITYRNRKTVFQSSETMQTLKGISGEAHKNCSYLLDTAGLPCFQNAHVKYYSFGEAYFKDLFDECNKAKRYILIECHKIVPGKLWSQLFDILRLKSREGVSVKLIYDDVVCTKYISSLDFEKMKNHGIETVAFNKVKRINSYFVNCRNYKRVCVIDGKIGFVGGFNIDDEYVNAIELTNATKDCAVRLGGDSVKNLIVMFFEDYQFATKKVVTLQEYFADNANQRTKDWVLPYSTNPIALQPTNKNIVLSMINNAKESISIITPYLALNDELRNMLIVAVKSGIKVRLIFSGVKIKKSVRILARSYFYDLVREGIEVYEYKAGKMTTKLILIDKNSALISTTNLDSFSNHRHFNTGVYLYGDSTILVYNDIREIISSAQLMTIKDLQKRKVGEKISAAWSKFLAIFR